MTPFDTYRIFNALNNHFFQGSYDYFKYKGQITVKPETFDSKSPGEKFRYEKLAKKFSQQEDLENFIMANLLESKQRVWIGNLFGGPADQKYSLWLARTQRFEYAVTSEIKQLVEDNTFNDLFKCDNHQHPLILKAHLRGSVSIDTLVILDLCVNFFAVLDKNLSEDLTWRNVQLKADKYRPFLKRININVPRLRQAIQKAVTGMGVTT